MKRPAFLLAALLLLASGVAPAKDPEMIDAEPDFYPSPAPRIWTDESLGTPTPTFEEDTSTAVLWDTGTSFIQVESDSLPTRIYVDGHALVQTASPMIVQVPPGRHFVSYFPAHRVQLAFRKTVPGRFWRALSDRVKLAGEYDLISSYDESAVTEGTRWLDASRSDTSSVSLSWHAARHAYIRTGHHTAWALFGITTAIAVAMVISEALVDN